MDSLKQRVQQMLGYPFVLESWISALEGSYNDLSELLREARRSSDIAALTAAEDLLDDLYRQQDDQANPTAHQTYCRGRVSQMLKDVHAEVKELERLEKLELTDGQMQVLWELVKACCTGAWITSCGTRPGDSTTPATGSTNKRSRTPPAPTEARAGFAHSYSVKTFNDQRTMNREQTC
jgi:hypothetical protein